MTTFLAMDRPYVPPLKDIEERDGQTRQVPVDRLPLKQAGTIYDHARMSTSDYHVDSGDLAMGDRHALLGMLRQANIDAKRARWFRPDTWTRRMILFFYLGSAVSRVLVTVAGLGPDTAFNVAWLVGLAVFLLFAGYLARDENLMPRSYLP